MDSPVIVDKASEFGESIDLDRPFPGFPFDDDNFGRRSDIRTHLDDLAARHPEFADHLLGPPWGEIPFHNSFRNRNRDIGNKERNNYQQGCSDEDATSQASGSSVASGTSVSSFHGESDVNQNQQNKSSNFEQTNKKSQIPQYGLRNTVDIGQHHHNMENTDKGNRGQRSMSAPPENRQSFNQQQEQQSPQQSQRYVSRIDITPQHNQPQYKSQQQPQQQQQQKPQQQSNVRHIPIFVEGRDEPVLPRSFDQGSQHRTFVNMDPHFQRSSPFGQHFTGRHQQWSPHFQEPFYQQPSAFEHPSVRQQQTHNFKEPKQQLYNERQPQPQQYCEKQPQQQHYEQSKQQKTQQPQQQRQELPIVLKDPLERVALVQKEVDALAEQVKQYNGISRTDKEYIYLDEMLTRELIKLDDIETEGRDNVRQARKNAIKSIQETISLLESKAPLLLQQMSVEEQEKQEDQISNITEEAEKMKSMNQKPEDQSQNKEAIPLPPGPSSPIKKTGEIIETCVEKLESFNDNQTANQMADPQQEANQTSNKSINTISMEKQEMIAMDTQQSSEESNITEKKKLKNVSEEKKQKYITEEKKADISIEKPIKNAPSENNSENLLDEKKIENISDHKVENTIMEIKETTEKNKIEKDVKEEKETEKVDNKQSTQEEQQKTEEKMDLNSGEIKQSPKSQKKGKKTKKQVPISDKPIPLPAPESTKTK
ncbi:BAG domain-containing protein Samui-like isoform X2 [Apis dorsata]|uniref:BAG domain-containing protein Samui-like isoform X2 n=1 Tax=Apis dorsata TaxID=7462 RepID=UPI0003DF6C67|nr:BAG domain-containing protein Samui-like isoform X2 [Apis dorsata]XP_006616702.1 BAG domain-containing protein Samui-like isoform X2 [Apis dorsata]